ncbi:hypothetical protein ACGFT2_11255 [Streptomyces sp. NPDC048514]|uniref:hypothetical protein n=1 Tax=Streptomyces sp. NPDC048514 TaxID=3365564 RepID=UPI0037232A6B
MTPGGKDCNPDGHELRGLGVLESRAKHARRGPIITYKPVNGGNGRSDGARGGDTQIGGNGNSGQARGGDTQIGGNGNSDEARGGDTQPPSGQTNVDYGIWTNPNPGPVVN